MCNGKVSRLFDTHHTAIEKLLYSYPYPYAYYCTVQLWSSVTGSIKTDTAQAHAFACAFTHTHTHTHSLGFEGYA